MSNKSQQQEKPQKVAIPEVDVRVGGLYEYISDTARPLLHSRRGARVIGLPHQRWTMAVYLKPKQLFVLVEVPKRTLSYLKVLVCETQMIGWVYTGIVYPTTPKARKAGISRFMREVKDDS